jgi:hypothetical protein
MDFVILYRSTERKINDDAQSSECQIPTSYSEVPTFNSKLQDSYSDTWFMVYFRLSMYRK